MMGVFRRMGFDEKWCKWTQLCMLIVAYELVVSGNEIGPIVLSRGLRQEDHISLLE